MSSKRSSLTFSKLFSSCSCFVACLWCLISLSLAASPEFSEKVSLNSVRKGKFSWAIVQSLFCGLCKILMIILLPDIHWPWSKIISFFPSINLTGPLVSTPNSLCRVLASRLRLDKELAFLGAPFLGLNLFPKRGIVEQSWKEPTWSDIGLIWSLPYLSY